ncbi:Shikimate O-hydroxycinnamoyltransferase [Phytophthora nicotianae]|uniref:ubiquitinyl hydrolase 1 n=1 Tax=Phytophthora nicotianae TaxID=4792 RepID=A0A0W8DEA3_PHYNI|nr:Shikimate O-hydroxycinnamoyltransferase [Phytophthora nicotianae]
MENSTEPPAPSSAPPILRKSSSLPAYDLALRGDDADAANSSGDDTNSARVASIAEEEDAVSLSSASELSLRGANGETASAPNAPTPLDTAMSPSPSSTSSDRAANDAPDVTTESKDIVPQLPKVGSARSAPTLERSHTSSELIGLRTRERQTNESAYSSPSSGSAPSFEIESVTLPTDGVTEAEIEKTTHTVFSVEVRLQGGLQWLIRKRYSDFRELHERLKRTSSPVKQLYFPKRHVFRNRHQSVVEQRRSELEKYINEVLDIRPLIRVPLFNFLEVYAHMESYERKLQRHKKELESERMKNMLPPEQLEDFSAAFKRLCSSKYLYHGNTSAYRNSGEVPDEEIKEYLKWDVGPARKLIKLRSRGGSTASNGSTAPTSHNATDGVAASSDTDKPDGQVAELEEDTRGEKPEDSELPAEAEDAAADGESSSPDTKIGNSTTADTEATCTTTTDSQRAAAAQAAAVRNRVRRGYTNSNLDQSRCLETKYNLYGVVNHQGALGGGHYTAYAKNFVDDQWYYYDDERVRVVEEQQVVSPSAYLLFYLRSDMEGVLVKDLFPKNMKPGKITDEDIERFVEEGDERRCSIM